MNNGASTVSATPAETSTPAATIDQQIESALEEIDALKESLQESLTGLKSLSAKLKQTQREHRANVKEFQSVRHTLKSLQSVKL